MPEQNIFGRNRHIRFELEDEMPVGALSAKKRCLGARDGGLDLCEPEDRRFFQRRNRVSIMLHERLLVSLGAGFDRRPNPPRDGPTGWRLRSSRAGLSPSNPRPASNWRTPSSLRGGAHFPAASRRKSPASP